MSVAETIQGDGVRGFSGSWREAGDSDVAQIRVGSVSALLELEESSSRFLGSRSFAK